MGAIAYAAAVLADAPKAYWKLQEPSGLPQDFSGNGLDMTSTLGTPDYQQPGPMGVYGIQYGNSEGHFRNTVSTAVDNFTAELWILLVTVGANDQQFFINGNGGLDGWALLVDSNSSFQAIANNVAFLANSANPLTGQWQHLVVLRRAGTWEYYLNGAVDTANAGANAPNPAGGSTQIGNASNATTILSHVSVYETALSAARITAHYAAGISADNPPIQSRLGWPRMVR